MKATSICFSSLLAQVFLLLISAQNLFAQWQALPIPNPDNKVLRSLFFTDESTGFIAGDDLILKTTDGGDNWQTVFEGDSSGMYYLRSIVFIDSDSGIVVGEYQSISGNNGIMLRTNNRGQDWNTVSLPSNSGLYDISFIDDTFGIATGDNGVILKSTDGGQNWMEIISGSGAILNHAFLVDNQTGYASGFAGAGIYHFLKTTDGGNNWNVSTLNRAVDIFFTSPDTGYVGATDPAEAAFYKTTDGGENWVYRSVASGPPIQGLFFTSAEIGYLGAGWGGGQINPDEGGLYKTTNAGTNWNRVFSGYVIDIHFSNESSGFVLRQDSLFTGATVSINYTEKNRIDDYYLFRNYPNPFNPATTISYSIPTSGFVTLTIYDILGREIQTLVNKFQAADRYSVNFDASGLSSGIYLYRLWVSTPSEQAGNRFVKTRKMLLMQ